MKKLLAAFAAGCALCSASAHAVYLDFVAEAAGNERGVADGTVINFGGVDVTFSSLSAGAFYAYFDDEFLGNPAGLGVCEQLISGPGSGCAFGGDDNIRVGDAVTLTFDEAFKLSNFSFSDRDHLDLNGNSTNTLWIAINDPNNFVQYTFAQAIATTFYGVELIRFAFDEGSPFGVEYYVNGFSAEVPLPAAAPLMLLGIAGLTAIRRRKRH